ncbi:MAG TPA: cupredoxin domain-containing protein [Candidatus Baltobacteraceae bacterium]|nr:cupredoxin domain-containing protein [Candidatus Baltobacteraceae bacterium]
MSMRPIFARLFGIVALVAAAACVLTTSTARASDSATLVASNWTFSHTALTAHVGVPMTLQLTSKEGVHGIQSDDLGIPNTMVIPGKTVTVTFTPKKAGTYVVHCSVPCGSGHATMAFTVNVVP